MKPRTTLLLAASLSLAALSIPAFAQQACSPRYPPPTTIAAMFDMAAVTADTLDALPDVDVVLGEMSSADQVNELLRGQIHAGFVNASAVPPQLAFLPMAEDEFLICLPEDHAHAQCEAIELTQLVDERFVMFSRDVAPANYDNVIAIFSRAGIHPRLAHAARQWLTIVAMVANGLGVSVVPRSLAQSRVHGVRFVKIKGEQVRAPAMLVWNPAYCPPTLRSFIECAERILQPR